MLGHKGVRNLPMTMIASHIRENVFTESEAKEKGLKVNAYINYHGLGKELFLKVIAGLDDVTEAYRGTPKAADIDRRESYFLLISQYTDKNGNIINVPVYINKKGLYNRAYIDTNKIATVFGRDELRDYIARQIQAGNLVRIKKRSSKTSESASPINAHYGKGTSDSRISQNPKSVKRDFSLKDSEYTTYKAAESKSDTNSAKNLEIKANEEYNGNINHSLKNGSNPKTKIQYSPTGIKLSKNEYAKFHQSTSTDYYMSYKTHEGLQYQSCVTDDTHILYIYEDGGFGNYNVVAKIDFANEDIIKAITEEIRNVTTYRITDLVNRVLQTFEVRRSGYSVYNTLTKKRISSRGNGALLEGQPKPYAGRTDGSGSRVTGDKRGTGIDGSTDGSLNEEYNERVNYSLKDGAKENNNIATINKLIRSIQGRSGLKYDGGKVIHIPNNDMATLRHKFMTEHHYSNRSGGIIDCIDCFGQGGKKHYFYIFYVGEDNRVAPIFRLDYQYIERYMDEVQKISNEMGYKKDEFIRTTSGNGKGIDRIRNLAESDSIYDVFDAREGANHQNSEGYNNEGGERGADNGRSGSGISNGYNEPSNHGTIKENKDFSLKGTLSDTELREAITNKKLDKYVDEGIITTEKYDELVKTYGVIPEGEKPHRAVQVPQKTAEDKKVSQTVRTILEAKATPDEFVPTIEKMVEDGIFSYDAYTDEQAIKDADSYIKEYGWDESLDDWFKDVEKGVVSKQHTAMGWALYNNAANIAATTTSETERTSAVKTSLKILDAMVRHQRSAAQALQATRILKQLSPETQLYAVQKSVKALQKELADKYGDKAPDLKINEELAEQFLTAETDEERAEIEAEIYKDIGRQMPSRFIDKWNAWRYLAMLGNPRTHVRNIVGNTGFAPVVFVKDLAATAIESIVYRVSGKKTVRGKALVIGSKTDRALLKAAWGDYGNVADKISNGGKYNDSAMANQHIEEGRRIFKFKPLEAARKGNSALLEKEDMWFAQPHYAYALAQYCKANNITAEQIKRGKAIAPARDYAIKEAQKATYRDTNAFSQLVSELGRSRLNDSKLKKVGRIVIEGILPFRKTPANILVRGVEYSPIGLLKGLTYDLSKVSKGKMSASEAIDNISAGLTGTGLLALGVFLAAQGLIRGHGGEDKDENEFEELMGHQAYALELPDGTSITLDWLAPEALPFFVGVNIWEATKGSEEEVNMSSILKAVSGIIEPMLEMSCLQGLNDLFEGIGYASSNDTSGLVSVISSAVTSYITQGIPTLFGQTERTGEAERMSTYTEKNAFLTGDMQYTLGKASAKIPFWDYNQIPYIDAWGRREASGVALKRGLNNFLNPAYTSTVKSSRMEKELLRLYESTGEASVFPSRADKYFTVDGERKDLTAEEYVRYATL